MRRSIFLSGVVSALTLATVATLITPSHADVTLTRTDYKGWKDAYRLSNGEIEIVVVPELGGRIMRYGFVGGPNQLWENPTQTGKPMVWGEWTNHGGEKAWPWPQDLWGFPPPIASDQAPFGAEVYGTMLELTSPRIVPYGVRIVRNITLDPKGTGVHLVTRLVRENAGDSLALSPWTVAQVPAQPVVYARLLPSAASLPGSVLKLMDTPFKTVTPQPNGILTVERDPGTSSKIGTDADILATVQDDTLFIVKMEPSPTNDARAPYVAGERAQIYNYPNSAKDAAKGIHPYIELEMTAPKHVMKRGEFVTLTQSWHLRRLSPGERSPEAVGGILKQMP